MNKKPKILVRHLLCNAFLMFLIPFSSFPIVVPLVQHSVTGTITDGQGVPLSGVTVRVQGAQQGTATARDGTYAITVDPNGTLLYSAIGFISQTAVVNGRTAINVKLEADVTQLEGVTLNAGYYTVKERERTGNIATIKAKTIKKQPVNNPLAAMQGHLSGVNIVQNSGVPGGGFDIEIRGRNFLNGTTNPLFIVDGVPYGSQTLASSDLSGDIVSGNISPLNAINPNDIQSIEVLKDAGATSIYGSRGANGVVLITTKKGKAGKTRFNAELSSTFGSVPNFLDLMSTEQYLEVRREGISNDGFGAFLEDPAFDFIWPDVKSWDNTRYTDWQEELIGGTAYRNNAQVSVSGGSPETQFLISGSFLRETTVFPGEANYKKGTGHSNINHRSKNDRFKINLSTIYTHEKNLLPRSDFTRQAYRLEPNAPEIYDEEGNINWENNTWDNPLASLEEIYEVKINTLIVNAGISYLLLPNLELKTNLGYNTYDLESFKTLPSTARSPRFGFTPQNYSSITTNSSKRESWIVEPQLNWRKQWDKAKLDVLIGTTFQRETTQQLVQRGIGFPINDLIFNLSAAGTIEVLNDTDSEYNYQAVFGRANLNWDKKYILNVTGRRDGSSRFGPGRQFGNFGAVGLAWLFSNESIFGDSSFLSYGKLRASYGTTGSDNVGDYRFLNTYNVTGFDYDGVIALEPTGIFNPFFGWEENKKLEAAIELGFFKDRILLNTSWFRNRSSNQLTGIPLAATTGFSELTGNFDATVQNTGLEIDLRTVNVQDKNFRWSTTFNLTVPKNELVEFPGLETSSFANRLVVGEPLTIVKLYNALGVDPETGVYQFEDHNDDGAISGPEDRQWIEDLGPKYFGGLGNTLSYKGLTLDFFFQFRKQKAFNAISFIATPGFRGNLPVSLLDRWQQPGDTNPIQRASAGLFPGEDTNALQSGSNAAVSDASFIRMRNISLSYKLPTIENGLDINIYLQGQNLFTITDYDGPDPEQPSNNRLPQLRQISLGLQVGF